MSETQTTAGAETEATASAEGRKRAEASNFLPIVRGRLPLIYVHAARFDEVLKTMSTKDVAAKLGTSVGKVFDIRKGRNFEYVTESFKPTAEDVAAADAWIAQVGGSNAKGLTALGDKDLLQKLLDGYKERGLASAEEAAALSAARGANRKVGEKKAPAAPATTAPVEAVQTASTGSADDLLS